MGGSRTKTRVLGTGDALDIGGAGNKALRRMDRGRRSLAMVGTAGVDGEQDEGIGGERGGAGE
jgi:hypothetical protein